MKIQEIKKEKSLKIKEICKKYKVIAKLSVEYLIDLRLTISSGEIDFYESRIEKDSRWWDIGLTGRKAHEGFTGEAKAFLDEVLGVMYEGHYVTKDRVSWWVDIKILSSYKLKKEG